LVTVFVTEDCAQDALHRGSVGEDADRPAASSNVAKALFDGVGGSDSFAPGQGLVVPAGEQLIEIITQANDSPWDNLPPSGLAKRRAAERARGKMAALMTVCRSILTASWSATRTLFETFPILCAQQRRTRTPG